MLELRVSKQVHAATLTAALRSVRPAVEGIVVHPGRLLVKGATDADRAVVQAVVEAHQAEAVEDAHDQHRQRFQDLLRDLMRDEAAWDAATPAQQLVMCRTLVRLMLLGQQLGRW